MNSATKFDSFKQSLASMGRNSQALQSQQISPTSPISQIQNAGNISGNQYASQYIGSHSPSSQLQINNVQPMSAQYQSNMYRNSPSVQPGMQNV